MSVNVNGSVNGSECLCATESVTVCIVVYRLSLSPIVIVYRLSPPQQLQDSAELSIETKSNIHRQRLLQPIQDYQINELPAQGASASVLGNAAAGSGLLATDKEAGGKAHEEAKPRGGLKKVSTVAPQAQVQQQQQTQQTQTHNCLGSHLQTYSIKERRSEAPRLNKMRLIRDPPLITTTAATPQDSPSTTMEPGMSFRQWGEMEVSFK